MFSKEEILEVKVNEGLIRKYMDYVSLLAEGESSDTTLGDLINKISQGECGNCSLLESVNGVLDAFIFNASYSIEEMIASANNSIPSRMAELKLELDPEAYATVETAVTRMSNLPKINLEQSMEQSFQLASISSSLPEALKSMSEKEVTDMVMELVRINQVLRSNLK
jgi:hypothetical protein